VTNSNADKFINSISLIQPSTPTDNSIYEGIYAIGVDYGDIVRCEDHLSLRPYTSGAFDLSFNVNVGTSDDPLDNSNTFIGKDILSEYFQQTEATNCPMESC
jgi:hypothetical protein